MSPSGLRVRIERLLRGVYRHDDLMQLFLFIRDRADGRESIIEIGDFVAHCDERVKGILTREVRDWHAVTCFHMPRIVDGVNEINLSRLPRNTPQILYASLRRSESKDIKRAIGIRSADAYRNIEHITKHFAVNGDGTLGLPRHLASKGNVQLLQHLLSAIIARPAFDAEKLCSDLSDALRSNGLLSKTDAKRLVAAYPIIALFAISVMHNTSIVADDGARLRLCATADQTSGHLSVLAPGWSTTWSGGGTVSVVQTIFSTTLDAREHCSPALMAIPTHEWTGDLEINIDGRLDVVS